MHNSKIIIILILLIGISSINTINGNGDSSCDSVTNILLNKSFCDRKAVDVEGEVTDLIFKISKKGNKYTTFNLTEGNYQIKVFSFEYLPISEGDLVRVNGIYYTEKLYEEYSFPNEINTMPYGVTVLKHKRLLSQNHILMGLLVISLVGSIIISVYLYKKNREKNKKKINYLKGYDFEKYVISLLDEKDWNIENLTRDISEEVGRHVKSDSDPDVTVKNLNTGKILSIECKYRSKFYIDRNKPGILWAKSYQIKQYNNFQQKNGHPVYVVIGVGGSPSKPENIFLIPLYRLKYPFANEDYLKKFEIIPPDKKFIFSDFLSSP